MWGQLIAQAGETTRAAVWCLLAQLAYLSDECVDLLLLFKNGLVELLHQVFGEACLDFKVHQAFVVVVVWHVCKGVRLFISVWPAQCVGFQARLCSSAHHQSRQNQCNKGELP
jgi:hypothetical protein